jgi:hypothetical protein
VPPSGATGSRRAAILAERLPADTSATCLRPTTSRRLGTESSLSKFWAGRVSWWPSPSSRIREWSISKLGGSKPDCHAVRSRIRLPGRDAEVSDFGDLFHRARVGPTTPKSIDPRWLRSIRPTRASRPSDASVDPTDARNIPGSGLDDWSMRRGGNRPGSVPSKPARSALHPGGPTAPGRSAPGRPNPYRDRARRPTALAARFMADVAWLALTRIVNRQILETCTIDRDRIR